MKTFSTVILLTLFLGIAQAQDSVTTPDRRMEEIGRQYEALSEQSNLVLEKMMQESHHLLFRNQQVKIQSGLESVQALLNTRRMLDAIQEETEAYFFGPPAKSSGCLLM